MPLGYTRVLQITDSTVISEISYNFGEKKLRVRFSHTDSTWEYEGVYPSDFARLACAYSVGEVFNESIRGRYDCVRIDPVPVKKIPATRTNVMKRRSTW